jgi:adenine phosphoribosyltransferase
MEEASALRLIASRIRDIPDFPKPGILFKDITPILADQLAFRAAIDLLAVAAAPLQPTQVVAIESRGFIFGAPLAVALGLGFAPVRKPGKLPYKAAREEYSLEYGSGVLEMHEDAVAGQRVLIVDDLLATGGTAAASARLCQRLGATVVGFAFVIELAFLAGRESLDPATPVRSLLTY